MEAGHPARAGILAALRRHEAAGLRPTLPGQFDAPTARAISRAMEQASIRQSRRARRVGDYRHARLEVAGTPGRGSTFTLRIPVAPVREERPTAMATSSLVL